MAAAVAEARELGSYRLVERLGAGGMGEVWRAEHRMLSRPAAIKLIGSDALAGEGMESAELIRRFELEAQATAALSSPHTVALYDFGVAEDGRLYYVMEMLHGLDLDRMVSHYGPLSPERTVHLLLQVCDSLDEAHAAGLVHRDIKPSNVHVGRLGRRWDAAKVLDFGLVKRRFGAAIDEAQLTVATEIRGTPAFMAPEMVKGQTVDARTDLYAVGCLAYWMLTGGMVFEARTALEMIARHLDAAPAPPSEHTDRAVPIELDRIVLDCLAKDPARRPASARELARRLRAVPFADAWNAEKAESWWEVAAPEVVERAERAMEPAPAATSAD
jgi:serine/threonine-protein kinase